MSEAMEDLGKRMFRSMLRDGCLAGPELQRVAFVKWLSAGTPQAYSNLAARMNHIAPVKTKYPYHRVADGLVQRLRKEKLIARRGATWILTDSGQNFLEHHGHGV